MPSTRESVILTLAKSERVYREMTVALLRERKDLQAVEVAFSESARFYRL